MKLLFSMLAVLTLLTSAICKKNHFEPPVQHQLLGRWKYTGKSGGYAGKYEAANPSVSNVIEFEKERKYVHYVNNEPDVQGTYELLKLKSIYSGKDEYAIRFDPVEGAPKTGMIITVVGDTLSLAENVHDGFTTGYAKLK